VTTLTLTPDEQALLAGDSGDASAMAMRIVVAAAELLGAEQLIEISSAHIDGCLHHGDGGVEFAEALVRGGGRMAVPTTLNVGAMDLLHPGIVRTDAHNTDMARRQMQAYVAMGAEPTFTCAPYQVGHEPDVGQQVAWGESNAIAFVNSVLGARTERYGDFLDACCAITGRAPLHGLHRSENRRAQVVIDVSAVPEALKARDVFFPVLGSWLGLTVGDELAAIEGLPVDTTRDQLKALGAAAASTGSVALFHVVGVTPEAPTLAAALGGGEEQDADSVGLRPSPPGWASQSMDPLPRRISPTSEALRSALARLSTAGTAERIDSVAVGSPHFSLEEFTHLAAIVSEMGLGTNGSRLSVPFYVCTARATLAEAEELGLIEGLRAAGVEIVADTCVVVTPILSDAGGVLMTNSGKFAHYGPSTTGYEVVYGSLEDCVASATTGEVERDEGVWSW
jgi:predicted aconitase